MKDFRIPGRDKPFADSIGAIEALRKAKGWKQIFTSATFAIDETTDAVCAYETAEDCASHSVVYTPATYGVVEKVDPVTFEKTEEHRMLTPAKTEATDAPRITWTHEGAKK